MAVSEPKFDSANGGPILRTVAVDFALSYSRHRTIVTGTLHSRAPSPIYPALIRSAAGF